MKGKKKKGNALMLLMTMILMITVIGTTMTTAIAYTTKQNVNNKNYEDLTYAAESGIEYALTKCRTTNIANTTMLATVEIPILINSYITEVSVVAGNRVDNKIPITSTATDRNGRTKVVKANLKGNSTLPPTGADIFTYGIAASENVVVKIKDGSGGDLSTTKINGGTNITLPTEKLTSTPPVKNPPEDKQTKNTYQDLEFKSTFTQKESISVSSGNTLFSDLNSLYNMAKVLNEDGSTVVNNGVGKIVLPAYNIGNAVRVYYDVYLVNAKKLVITPGINALDEVKSIIICSGDIEISVPNNQTNKLNRSTLFGKNVTMIEPSSLHVVGAPALTTDSDSLTTRQINKLNEVISKYITNWNTSTPGGGGGTGTEEWTIENGSYEYN